MAESLRIGDVGADVATLQRRLNARGASLNVDHVFGSATDAAVRDFQRSLGLVVDGIVGPRTQGLLLGVVPPAYALTQADIEAAAATLGCDVAAIQAVVSVESPKGGFLPDGRVVILFERHVFYRQLQAAGIDPRPLEVVRPDICNPKPGGYIGGPGEYARLAAAKQFNEVCALESASWGRFQIMGNHYETVGYATVQDFVADMATGEAAQLRAFVKLTMDDADLHEALQHRDWLTFARIYNGPNYAINHYDARLAAAFKLHGGVASHITPEAVEAKAAVTSAPEETDPNTPSTDAGTSRRGKRQAKAEAAA